MFWAFGANFQSQTSKFYCQNFEAQLLGIFIGDAIASKEEENDDDDRSIRGREVQLIRSLMTGHTG